MLDQNFTSIHGTYIRCLLINRCAREEHSLLSDMLKAFDSIEISHKSIFFAEKAFFPSCVRNMFWVTTWYKYHASTYNAVLSYWRLRALRGYFRAVSGRHLQFHEYTLCKALFCCYNNKVHRDKIHKLPTFIFARKKYAPSPPPPSPSPPPPAITKAHGSTKYPRTRAQCETNWCAIYKAFTILMALIIRKHVHIYMALSDMPQLHCIHTYCVHLVLS